MDFTLGCNRAAVGHRGSEANEGDYREGIGVEAVRDGLERLTGLLAAPRSNGALELVKARDVPDDYRKVRHQGRARPHLGRGDGAFFLKTEDGDLYPARGDVPILLFPERLVPQANTEVVDIALPQYYEAYTEMGHYDCHAGQTGDKIPDALLALIDGGGVIDTARFPDPAELWIDDVHDSLSQYEGYSYLAPTAGRAFLQMGGSGTHAVKALLAGARIAVLLTPMAGEARFACEHAARCGVSDNFFAVVGVGEELPFAGETFDAVYAGGCVHHMRTEMAFKETLRVLRSGGRFAAVDPWKTLLHTVGTAILGKQEASVFCRPIDASRLSPISLFPRYQVRRHGPFLRYAFLGIQKVIGLSLAPVTMMKVVRLDDAVGRILAGRDNTLGGSLLMCGEK